MRNKYSYVASLSKSKEIHLTTLSGTVEILVQASRGNTEYLQFKM